MHRRLPSVLTSLVVAFVTSGVPRAGAGEAPDFAPRFEEIKRTATPLQLYLFLRELPKGGDLHNHLGGSGLAETWLAIATDPARNGGRNFYTRTRINNCPAPAGTDRGGRPVDTLYWATLRQATYDGLDECRRAEFTRLDQLTAGQRAEWLSSVRLDRAGEGREEFFEVIWVRLADLLSDAAVVLELLVENMKLFGAEGVRYVEYQAPYGGLRRPDNTVLTPDETAALYEERLARADARATGVEVRFLATVLRFAPTAEQKVEEAADFIARHPGRWVGLNMAGREDNDKGHPLRFLDTYRRVRRTHPGLKLSIHAGEVDEPNRHVRDTLLLGATRIGHGVNLITDPDTMLLMRDNRYLVEVNLVSNRLLEYTPDIATHPFPEYLRFGIPVCLNTDDRGMWDSNMTDEYFTAVTAFNLSWDEVVGVTRNSLSFSFLQPAAKARLLAELDAALTTFAGRYTAPDALAKIGSPPAGAVSGYAARTWKLPRE